MDKTEEIKNLLNALPDIDEGDKALLKINTDYKFHGSHIVANQKGLIKLARGLLNAAVTETGRHKIAISVPDKPENESYPFGVSSIERDERLEYKAWKIDGENYTFVDRDKTIGEKLGSVFWRFIIVLIFLSVFIGFWQIIQWVFGI